MHWFTDSALLSDSTLVACFFDCGSTIGVTPMRCQIRPAANKPFRTSVFIPYQKSLGASCWRCSIVLFRSLAVWLVGVVLRTQLWIALDFYQCPVILLFGASSHGGYLSLNFDSPNSVKRLGFSRHVAECNPSCAPVFPGCLPLPAEVSINDCGCYSGFQRAGYR